MADGEQIPSTVSNVTENCNPNLPANPDIHAPIESAVGTPAVLEQNEVEGQGVHLFMHLFHH